MSRPVAGQNWTSPATGMEFVWIDALKLWVGKYEVTNEEYRKKEPRHDSGSFSGHSPNRDRQPAVQVNVVQVNFDDAKAYARWLTDRGHSLNRDRQPVVQVNFDDAKAYARWLTDQDRAVLDGARYRLPTEAEWMTFAQCGDGREYPWGNEWPPPSGRSGNYSDRISGYTSGFPVTAEVDRLWRNPWGLHGVGGNVWEACASNDAADQAWGAWRGASWSDFIQHFLRCSYRYSYVTSYRNYISGFRVLLSR